ncbi:hypothetical protein [Cellulomonas fengjieae]|uniref:Uncharacterized protein n=1 Tax=Cellulomonas fengjieae TaxID=2819978 RepID=A0ABS3SJN7_9CELL|nr:hypothetical protein [Cellulomonas fengjieae]MBO3085175.1 hypothetical protein [Cellulomonas fengjieae]QVI66253.1 hypothetical protein KG102_01085 [Cellulomonas fengjieae]
MTDDYEIRPRPIPADCPWSVGRVRFAGGDETARFEADLLRRGVKMAKSPMAAPAAATTSLLPSLVDGWVAIREFERYAEAWGAEVGVRFEPNDALIHELLERWWSTQPTYR